MSSFLRYVTTEALAGRADGLRQADIARGVLDRPDIDPLVDPSVRVLARRVRRALDRHYSGPGALEPVRIEVPAGSFVPVFRHAGPAPRPLARARTTSGPAIVVTCGPRDASDRRSARLASALGDALVAALSRHPDCRVTGPVDLVAATAEARRALARRLGGDQVLEIRVNTLGEDVRVGARLADARSGVPWWGAGFRPAATDGPPFALADALGREITGAVAGHGGAIHAVAPASAATDPVVSLALHRFFRTRPLDDPPALRGTIGALEDAARALPDDGLVLSALASAYFLNGLWRFGASLHGMDRAFELASRAASADPRNPLAAAILLNASVRAGPDAVRAHAERLLTLTGETYGSLICAGTAIAVASDWAEGTDLVRRATAMTPDGDGRERVVFVVEHLIDRDDAAALAEFDRVAPPPIGLIHLLRAVPLMRVGRSKEAVASLARARAMDPELDRADVLRHVALPEPAIRVVLEEVTRIDRAARAA